MLLLLWWHSRHVLVTECTISHLVRIAVLVIVLLHWYIHLQGVIRVVLGRFLMLEYIRVESANDLRFVYVCISSLRSDLELL
jgi:hypothetical protein